MERHDVSGDRLTLETLASQLAQAVGDEKALDVVAEALDALGLSGPILSRDEALEVLARIAETPGIVGICARFARTRVLLAPVTIVRR